MSIVGFTISYMVARIAGPIVEDWFKNETSLGRKIEEEKTENEIKKKRIILEEENKAKLQLLRAQFEQKKQEAEYQLIQSQADWNRKAFYQNCFPLRNPFEIPLGIELEYEENSSRLKKCVLKTTLLKNGKEVVPLRVISSLKNNVHPHASTINSELSMFIVNNYSSNGEHAVMSDIGAWREDAPANDASVNFLFMGLQGQPVMVLAPEYTDDGTVIRFKIWSWGLGEKLSYPAGFDFGWIDLDRLHRKILAEEARTMGHTMKKYGCNLKDFSNELQYNLALLDKIEARKKDISKIELERLLSLLTIPEEISFTIRKKMNHIVAQVYSCVTAMYADGYHLLEYGTPPKLPELLEAMDNIEFIFPSIRDYYIALMEIAQTQRLLTTEDVIRNYICLAESMNSSFQSGDICPAELLPPLTEKATTLLFDLKDQIPYSTFKQLNHRISNINNTWKQIH